MSGGFCRAKSTDLYLSPIERKQRTKTKEEKDIMSQKGKSTIQAKGITLVALVITIIVLLILAGVAINMAINSDGLFAKANEAVEGWEISRQEEQSQIQDLLDKMGVEIPKVASTVTETSEVAGVTKERTAPIPVGYTVSEITTGESPENTIAGGLVIYDIPEGAQVDWNANTITIGEATTNLQETVNQFVWIPVDDINQMVMCKSNTGDSQCNLQLIDGVLQCTNSSHESNKTNLCGRLYGTSSRASTVDGKRVYTTNLNFVDRSQTWSASGYREPDIVSDDKDDATSGKTYMETAGIADKTVATFSNQLTSDFTKMATSVAKYGGFYVSRYEVGVNGESKKNQLVLTAGTSTTGNRLAGNMWYGLYNTLRNTTIVDKSIVSTHMIWRKPVRPNDKLYWK